MKIKDENGLLENTKLNVGCDYAEWEQSEELKAKANGCARAWVVVCLIEGILWTCLLSALYYIYIKNNGMYKIYHTNSISIVFHIIGVFFF